MLLCNECNLVSVTVRVSAAWRPSVTPTKHPVNSCELGGMRGRDGLLCFFLFFSIILKMKKPRRRASCPGTAGTPHRNTLINTGSLEELKPPATSCSQTGESAEHLLHILLSVMRNRHTHTHTHTHISSLNFEHSLRISLWSFDSISVLRETDEIRALTSTHERSSHKNTHTHSRTLEDKEPI